ncbi:MAG: Na/Pi cotransporter family protein [Micavibrio sp.]|nr:Na/Pi cotransporter family protein [Micavibrio sp.]
MVKHGFTRAYGTSLRRAVQHGTKNRTIACLSGIGITALLQSSTAATLLLITFVKKNSIPLAMALAVIIGADISTTLVAQVLIFDLSWLSPALLAIGIIGYIKYENSGRKRHILRAVIGLGLMLLSLSLLRQASAPLTHSETLPLILGPLEQDPITAILFAAILTYVMHSSLATVLLFSTLAVNGIIDLELSLLLVLGANLGGSFIAFVATYKDGVSARRITVGNIIMRCTVVVIALPLMQYIHVYLQGLPIDVARNMMNFHVGFNLVLAAIFLPTITLVAKTSEKLIPAPQNAPRKSFEPMYLDDKAIDSPVVALAAAARETLRMAEMVETMLQKTIETFRHNNDKLTDSIRRKDNDVDKLYFSIKLYLIQLTQQSLDPKEADRYLQIITFATNLEHIGDIIDKSLMELAQKKISKQERFSEKGWDEICNFHSQVLANMKLAQTIFLSEDPSLAQQLVDNKKDIRLAEVSTSQQHFGRLREGLPETIATSAIHLDIIRDYRRINSYVTAVAYSILENAEKYKRQRKSSGSNEKPA